MRTGPKLDRPVGQQGTGRDRVEGFMRFVPRVVAGKGHVGPPVLLGDSAVRMAAVMARDRTRFQTGTIAEAYFV